MTLNNVVFSQTIDIDEKFGFKEFVINSKINKWSGQISEWGRHEKLPGLFGYTYDGNCCNTILDFNVKNIILFFEDKTDLLKIILVQIEIPDYDGNGAIITDDVLNLKSRTEYYFGPVRSQNARTGSFSFEWKGEKVIINLEIAGSTPNVNGIYKIAEKEYLMKSNNSKF